MSDYISRDVAVNGLAKIINESDMPEDWNKGMSNAMSALFRIPAADVREVARGKWIKEPSTFVWNADGIYAAAYKCNNCGAVSPFDSDYCFMCGADMREES